MRVDESPRNMDIFPLEVVGGEHVMPSTEEVEKIRNKLWRICAARTVQKRWDIGIPFGEFTYRPRNVSDPKFRTEDFEGRKKGMYDEEAPGPCGLDLLGRYCFDNSLVTIYIDSCKEVEQWYDVPLDRLVRVVLIHELAHLVTHRGFGAGKPLPPHFWEYTAQCGTYTYLQRHDQEALKVFKKLSSHQPFIYRTWESLEALRAVSDRKSEALVKRIFSAFAGDPLDPPRIEHNDMYGSGYEGYEYEE
jgi:hypothetical protein